MKNVDSDIKRRNGQKNARNGAKKIGPATLRLRNTPLKPYKSGTKGGNRLKKRVLFICTNNSARSQMAEGILNALYGDKYEAYSAGTDPTEINPYAVKVMAEIGIDISKNQSKSIEDLRGLKFDLVVTVCDRAKERCPFFPGATEQIHKSFRDPANLKGSEKELLAEFRQVRDEIRDWIIEYFGERESIESGKDNLSTK